MSDLVAMLREFGQEVLDGEYPMDSAAGQGFIDAADEMDRLRIELGAERLQAWAELNGSGPVASEDHTLFLTIEGYGETLELACSCGWAEELGAEGIGSHGSDYGTPLTNANESARQHLSATNRPPE